MIRRRLYLQIYLAFLAIAVLTIVGTGVLVRTVIIDDEDAIHVPTPVQGVLSVAQLQGIPPADAGAERSRTALAELAARTEVDLALVAADGAVQASVGGSRFPSPPTGGREPVWTDAGPQAVLWMPLEDGRWLGARTPASVLRERHRQAHPYFAAILGTMLLLSAAGCYPLARRITRRLESFQRDVDAFGRGDLERRVDVPGHDEVARLAAQFNVSADRIASLVESQRRVLAHASHELRSPLARVRMALEIMESRVDTNETRRAFEEALKSTAELDQLVGDILLASRMDGGGAVREPVRIDDLVAEIAGERSGVVQRLDAADVVMLADGAALGRMLRNLLDNAELHARGAEVEVSTRTEGGHVTIEVADRGPGIPDVDLERIFEAFYRVEGHSEGGDGGVGLGLALVRHVADAHDGTVHARARAGGGSRFIIEMPVQRSSET